MKKSYLIALVMSGVIVLWMMSGLLSTQKEKQTTSNDSQKSEQQLLVQVSEQVAQPIQLTLNLQGHVEPHRSTTIRSDIAGRINDVRIKEGMPVKAGSILARLDIEDRRIKLDREKALLRSRQNAYSRAQSLSKQDLQSKSGLEDAYAALKASEANVAQIEYEINKLDIKAPFSGVLDTLTLEEGDYVAANGEIAHLVDNSSLSAVVPVAQQDIQQLSLGVNANVTFATGETREGTVTYIAPLASESTRTFRVKISVNNPNRKIPAGISAEVSIPTRKVTGHFISPAILGLDASGQMGVKTVDETNSVVFHPASIIQAETNGVWVSGLPQTANIITVGQGFVEAGTKVDVQQSKTTNQANGSNEEIAQEPISGEVTP